MIELVRLWVLRLTECPEERSKHLDWVSFEAADVNYELPEVEFPLSLLHFRYEGLWLIQHAGQLRLRQLLALSKVSQNATKRLPLGSVKGFCEAFVQRSGLIPNRDYPSLGFSLAIHRHLPL
jgi:hypothetical protein